MSNNGIGPPRDYGIDHGGWRPHQAETVAWALEDVSDIGLAQCPTGLGKTAIARAVASRMRTIALCRTKNLQVHQYASKYGFNHLMGKDNYPCAHFGFEDSMADECQHEGQMKACRWAGVCEYLVKKSVAMSSSKISLNYQYWLTAKWPRLIDVQYLFLDECHQLSEITIGRAGSVFTKAQRKTFDLPAFPRLQHQIVNKLTEGTASDTRGPAMAWLGSALNILWREHEELENEVKANTASGHTVSKKLLTRFKSCKNLGGKMKATIAALNVAPDDWFIKSGPGVRTFRGRREPAFICKPLTARHHFGRYFLGDWRAILMSATIGDFGVFTDELGIEDYDSRIVPNQFTPDQRPIHILDAPAMGARKSHETDAQFDARFDKQADVIAEAILSQPHDWPGLILVTRKTEALYLARRLAARGLEDRVWPFSGHDGEYVPTDQQLTDWNERKAKVPNSIGISFSFWEGYDGVDERILIIAKVPFPVFGSRGSYDEAWRKYSGKRYIQVAAIQLAQGLGRTRRGNDGDYDIDGQANGFVAIADKSWSRIKKYLPSDVLDAIVTS